MGCTCMQADKTLIHKISLLIFFFKIILHANQFPLPFLLPFPHPFTPLLIFLKRKYLLRMHIKTVSQSIYLFWEMSCYVAQVTTLELFILLPQHAKWQNYRLGHHTYISSPILNHCFPVQGFKELCNWQYDFWLLFHLFHCVCMRTCMHTQGAQRMCGSQKISYWNQFSPSAKWICVIDKGGQAWRLGHKPLYLLC